MTAHIYKPSRTAMQSGAAKSHKWLLEFKDASLDYTDPLMGWSGSRNTVKQSKLYFDSQDEAIAYAVRQNIAYTLSQPHGKQINPKNYAENFKPKF